jgi:gas vesicle protein
MFRGFFWGLVAGVAIGLLFAPDRGEVTRSQLQARLNEWQSQAQSQMDQIKARSSSIIDQGRQAVNSTVSRSDVPASE